VHEIERGEDELGGDAERGAGEGGQREGGGRKREEVGREKKGGGGDELHDDPGLDAIDGEDAIGRSESAERCVVHEGGGAKQGETAEEPLFGHCIRSMGGWGVLRAGLDVYGIPVYR